MKDKVVVITGAGGVLCAVIAEFFAKNGAKVAMLDINKDALERLESEFLKKGFAAKGYATNVLDKNSLISACEEVERDFGVCDILINGAGGNSPKATTDDEVFSKSDVDSKDFFALQKEGVDFVFNLNFMGTFLTTQVFSKQMTKNGGVIINISSMNAFAPLTKIPAYSAAKAAVSNFTEWLAVYFAGTGIRVNAIAPGFFATNQNRSLLFGSDGSLTPRSDKILKNTPMGRFGTPEELLGAVEFLSDDTKSGFITGIILPIDGGFNAFSGV